MAARLTLAVVAFWLAGAGLVQAEPPSAAVMARADVHDVAGPTPRAHDTSSAARSIRCLTSVAEQLVRQGFQGSSTFRALVGRLEKTDVIVFIVTGPKGHEGGRGHGNLRLICCRPEHRFLRIWIDPWWRTRREQVGLLAHELHHALEIGDAPEAKTAEAIALLYRRIGRAVGSHSYDSQAAHGVGAAVEAELGAPSAALCIQVPLRTHAAVGRATHDPHTLHVR
jgi:hypothetical protein